MPEYLHPGVYIEEIERGPRPIEGVPTSTAAFLGEAERGPITPRLVTSYKDYQRWFGDVFGDEQVPAVRGQRVLRERRQARVRLPARRRRRDARVEATFGDFIVRAAGPGAWGNARLGRRSRTARRKKHGRHAASASACSSRTGATSRRPASIRSTTGRRLPRPQLHRGLRRSRRPTRRRRTTTASACRSSTSTRATRTRGRRARRSACWCATPASPPARGPPNGSAAARPSGADDPSALGADDFDGPAGRRARGPSRGWRRSSSIRTATSRSSMRRASTTDIAQADHRPLREACASASR